MANHPNRTRHKDVPPVPFQLPVWMREREAGKQPKPEQIRTLRRWTTATKPVMAAALHKSLRWYEEVESGRQAMTPNDWFAMRVQAHVMMSRMQQQAREIREERGAE